MLSSFLFTKEFPTHREEPIMNVVQILVYKRKLHTTRSSLTRFSLPRQQGECDMKIGTSLFLLVIILIAFGFVLSDDLNTHKSLVEITQKTEGLTAQLGKTTEKLNTCDAAGQADKQTIFRQGADITALKNDNAKKDVEIGSLAAQVSLQMNKISALESNQVRIENETTKSQSTQTPNPWSNVNPGIAIVILISQVVLGVFQKRKNADQPIQFLSGGQKAKGQYTLINRDELTQIIKMRRKK
jgi:hypothetical protein